MKPLIIFTGGGTAGHVIPNIALITKLKEQGWDIHYIGSATGIEKKIIHDIGIPYHVISSGKLRRYFSIKNFIDPFKIGLGILQSAVLCYRLKPNVVFSKGGFVAFPVVVGAWLWRIPIVAHESDITPGLANRLSFPFINKICLTFATDKKYFKSPNKTVVTGTPIRQELFTGNKIKARQYCAFNHDLPCLLIIGGSLGADSINKIIRKLLPSLLKTMQVIHICGQGKIDSSLANTIGYAQFEFVKEELADLFALATWVISRAGANSLYEILALAKPHILIPLSTQVSRGDQIHNARYFQQLGVSTVVYEEQLNEPTLLAALEHIIDNQHYITQKIKALNIHSATARITAIIKEYGSGHSLPVV